jgi:PhzF family phenazine biosynthesis protein
MRLLQIDAFTSEPFRGNPAAVCFLDRERDDQWMQNVAAEMNLAETAFLLPRSEEWSLRWFTPTVEVDLCGHATLASAHALWEEGKLARSKEARFHSRSGLLTASRTGDAIELNFPATPDTKIEAPPGLLESLGAKAKYIGKNVFDYLVEVNSEAEVRSLSPDFNGLKKFGVRGVIVTARASNGDYDFVSRYFAPGAGIDEDPATGSTHCCLAPFWGSRLSKTDMTAFQASRRGAILRVRIDGDRVRLGGHAVTVLRGDLTV